MARKIYRIDEFMGLDQSMGENGMAASYSPDACNMDLPMILLIIITS